MARRRPSLIRRALTARGRSLEITRAGWLFILLTLAVGFAAINSGSNLLHGVFGAQMALIVGSGIFSEAMVRRTVARRVPMGELHAGEAAAVRVELGNTDPRFDVFSVSVEDDDRGSDAASCAPVFAVRIPARATLELPATVTMPSRGRHLLPSAVVATRFPFGLFVKRRDLPAGDPVLVYPRIHEVPAQPSGDPHAEQGDAPQRRSRVGEFFALREYREGDDMRRIHWPAFARTGRAFVREHQAEGDRELILELAAGTTGEHGFEAAVEQCASAAVAELAHTGVAVGLRYAGELVLVPATGDEQRRRILDRLAVVGGAPA
ncbi:MAG: DUF58 domain-containing protein [Deltaproteobacteria bacterium]|nr:DUF58 domain-containing protein [Nannocystaceae bacterium]